VSNNGTRVVVKISREEENHRHDEGIAPTNRSKTDGFKIDLVFSAG